MQKKIIVVFLVGFLFSITNVSASEYYYKNVNGVSFSREEYDMVSKLYYDGYQHYMTSQEYNLVFSEYINSSNIISKTIVDYENPIIRATTHASASKSLTITKSCSSSCLIIVVANWTKSPNVRSYDLTGAYFSGVSLIGSPITNVVNSAGNTSTAEYDNFSNGFGVSAKLISTGSDMKITQTYRTTTGGHIYASYQHAKSEISLADSKKYTISYSGYGHVFLFDNLTIRNHYDGMGGVDIAV